jgi:hypothetical protein
MLRKAFAGLIASLALLSFSGSSVVHGTAGPILISSINYALSGACIGAAPCASTTIIDSCLNFWTVAAGVVYVAPGGANKTTAGVSFNVIVLLYYNGIMYQENSSNQWFQWTGTGWSGQIAGDPRGTAPGLAFGVQASGANLVSTQTGLPVTLIGGSMQGCNNGFEPAWCADIASLTTWWTNPWKTQHAGANTVRIQLDLCAYLNDTTCMGGATAGYAPNVQQIVTNATAQGLYVMISAQNSAPAGVTNHVAGQSSFLDATHGIPFWTAMANLYKNQPNVIFDVFNEPAGENVYNDWFYVGSPYNGAGNGKDTSVVGAGGTYSPTFNLYNPAASTTINWQVEGELQVLTLVRSLGATNLVLLSPTGFAGQIDEWLHIYQTGCAADTLHNCGVAQHMYGYNFGMTPIQAVVTAGFPVVETEFEASITSTGIGGCGTGCYTLSQLQGAGVVGFINCCSYDQGTPTMVFGPGSYPGSSGSSSATWLRPPQDDVVRLHDFRRRVRRAFHSQYSELLRDAA